VFHIITLAAGAVLDALVLTAMAAWEAGYRRPCQQGPLGPLAATTDAQDPSEGIRA
jgi:hypothetical protein